MIRNSSIKGQIIQCLKENRRWVSGGSLEDLNKVIGCKASTISRRLRELADEEPRVSRSIKNGYVWYRYQ